MSQTTPITQLRNLGPASSRMLADAGISTTYDLRELGPVGCLMAVRRAGHQPSLNLLWAIEGALTERAWNSISSSRKASLLEELRKRTMDEVSTH